MDLSTTERALLNLAERLATLERQEDRLAALERENQQLRAEMAALRRSTSRLTTSPDPSPVQPTAIERMSRRWMLRRAVQATAATVAAGVLLRHENAEVEAGHSTEIIAADRISTHYIAVVSESSSYALVAGTTNDASTIQAENFGTGTAVNGYSESGTAVYGTGLVGVYGTSAADGYGAVAGLHTGIGYGVVGDVEAAGVSGVLGRNSLGEGVRGEGNYGVHGVSSVENQVGVYGEHTGTGYGVIGNGNGASTAGVLGSNPSGAGVMGNGRIGVQGLSGDTGGSAMFAEGVGLANGMKATSTSSYGAVLGGGKAQLRLLPRPTPGKPTTGSHQVGELYLDKVGALFICTAPGTPGTWRKVTTALA